MIIIPFILKGVNVANDSVMTRGENVCTAFHER